MDNSLLCVRPFVCHWAETYRGGGGGGEQRQDAAASHDQVVHHLRDEVHAVVNKHHIVAAVHKIQDRLGGVAEETEK